MELVLVALQFTLQLANNEALLRLRQSSFLNRLSLHLGLEMIDTINNV